MPYIKSLFGIRFFTYVIYLLQRPEAPQGKTRPFDDTGSPIYSASTFPPNFGTIAVLII